MIIFFGPAGAGKSVQGQILAARHNWRWLSTGQLFRDTHDPDILKRMSTGELISDATTQQVVLEALERSKDIKRVVLDGFPRKLSQAKWLIQTKTQYKRPIDMVIVLEVPKSELYRRLQLRGRAEDTKEVIDERLNMYRQEIYPILSYFTEEKVPITHIDGTGTVGQVHDRVEAELVACSLV